MSLINGNLLLGSDFYMVGKSGERYYTFAKLNGKDLWISESPATYLGSDVTFYKFRFGEKTIDTYLGGVLTKSSVFYDEPCKSVISGNSIMFLSDLQLPAKTNFGDSGFYCGVWYDVMSTIELEVSSKVKVKVSAAPRPSGFAGFVKDTTEFRYMQFTFVPATVTSIFNGDYCKVLDPEEPIKYFTKYLNGEISPVSCDKLSKESRNCLFTDSKCNNFIGFRLAKTFEKCGGRILGPCDKGNCVYDSKCFRCKDTDDLEDKKQGIVVSKKKQTWTTVVLALALLVALILVVFCVFVWKKYY